MEPRNKLYMTATDFQQWNDYMGNMLTRYSSYSDSKKSCGDCKSCSQVEDELKVKTVTFVVTERCNLNCSYCYETHKTNRNMTKEIGLQAVDFLFDEKKINGYYDFNVAQAVVLEFIGGEPLLEIDLINDIVEYFKFKAFEVGSEWATNYAISISSNGILYTDPRVKEFLKRNPNRVSLSVTIDGNKELHDKCRKFHDGRPSYDIVEASIKDLVSKNDRMQTKITLCPENVAYLNDALKNVWSLGMVGAFTNCVYEEGWTVDSAKVLYNEMIKLADYLLEDKNYSKYYTSLFDETIGAELTDDKNWCGGNGQMLAIGVDGKCFPCIRFMKYALSYQEEQPIGDIFNGLDDKDENEWLNKLKQITMKTQSPEKCLTCKIAKGCALCTAYNYDKNGDPNIRSTYICETHKARVLANCYYWNKLRMIIPSVPQFKLNLDKKQALELVSEDDYNLLINLSKKVI